MLASRTTVKSLQNECVKSEYQMTSQRWQVGNSAMVNPD